MDSLHDPDDRGFASDNYSGVHPEVLAGLAAANEGHQPAYGGDVYTERLQRVFAAHFGDDAVTWPVWGGTGANVIGLLSMLPRWGAVICAETAHIHADEGGAAEKAGDIKLLTVATPDGKLTPELIAREAWGYGDQHRAQPLVVHLTQSSELGTVYTPAEVREIAGFAHERGMRVFMDGARLSNAAASLGLPLRAFTTDAGVDAVSVGGTKNGALGAEAIVVLDRAADDGLVYLRKNRMQLPSKMRFVSAQLLALFESDLWLRNARQANDMAQRLRGAVEEGLSAGTIRDVGFAQRTQANAVFATLPSAVAERLRHRFRFYDWGPAPRGSEQRDSDADAVGVVRWVCSFDTAPADVDAFVAAIAEETTA